MISHAKTFIFVHIPKTGGTSIARMLNKHGVMLQGKQNYDSVYFKHATAAEIKRMMGDEYDRYFTFAFVRNPWDWVVSNYEYNRGLHRPFVKGTEYAVCSKENTPGWARAMDFPEWLDWWTGTLKPSQVGMLQDEHGEMLVDEVLKFESLGESYERLARRIGLESRGKALPHLERSPQREKDYSVYYDPQTTDLVKAHFGDDLRVLGYPDEPVSHA